MLLHIDFLPVLRRWASPCTCAAADGEPDAGRFGRQRISPSLLMPLHIDFLPAIPPLPPAAQTGGRLRFMQLVVAANCLTGVAAPL
jgi:hypothetical protein